MRKIVNKSFNDDAWVSKHFEKLVDRFPGQFLVVVNEEPFIGSDARLLFKRARAKYPNVTPTCMPIPRKKDFLSIL